MEWDEKFLARAAGWAAMKEARALVGRGSVTAAAWEAPLLKGLVQEGAASYRAGLVIRSEVEIENICSCKTSRQWGTLCPHSVAVALYYLQQKSPPAEKQVPQQVPPTATPKKPGLATSLTEGDPLEVFIILPPNFESSTSRKVTLYFEGKFSKRRFPLDRLPRDVLFQVSTEDAEILNQLVTLAEGETPGMLSLEDGQLTALLPLLSGQSRITLGKSIPLGVSPIPTRLKLKAQLDESGEIRLELGAIAGPHRFFAGDSLWLYDQRQFSPIPIPDNLIGLSRGSVRLSRDEVPSFLSNDWPGLLNHFEVEANFKLEDFSFHTAVPLFQADLQGGLAMLDLGLEAIYGEARFNPGTDTDQASRWMADPKQPRRYLIRHFDLEGAAVRRLKNAGFSGPDREGKFSLRGEDAVLTFFARTYPGLQREWKVALEPRLEKSTQSRFERLEPRFQVRPAGQGWFHLDFQLSSGSGERLSPAEIQQLILSRQNFKRLPSGRVALMDIDALEDFQEVIQDCSPQQESGGFRIGEEHAAFLQGTFSRNQRWRVEAPLAWKERAGKMVEQKTMGIALMGPLDQVLRPYQKEGVGWLFFLRQNGFNGILADEMGLGKTLQVLAYFQTLRQKNPEHSAPMLVICPTSLVFNWKDEVEKFTPSLKTLVIAGSDRELLFPRIPEFDVIITSYALIRRDAGRYQKIQFDTVVLDEAQHIKNRASQNAQAVKAIRSEHRLVLTGTPMENSILDLWSIFDFLMPGYLGSAKDFRERYEQPIVRDKNAEVQARLARRVKPFLLRRLKREVAADLPQKIEQVAFCDLTEAQAAVYRQILEAGRTELFQAKNEKDTQKSRMMVFTVLLRLRQVCCDLRLLKEDEAAETSGKLRLFSELLDEILDGEHRVLVFSQFTSLLKLIRQKLEADEIPFCYLDGSTVDRGAVVRRFQKDSGIPVFLISLKAAGVGLNLTGADTVIHFDPWWNPAVEAQATDRAHRIGQTRVVTSYKLIARGTVEEKILKLQQRKRDLVQGILQDEAGFSASLDWNEIEELLAT